MRNHFSGIENEKGHEQQGAERDLLIDREIYWTASGVLLPGQVQKSAQAEDDQKHGREGEQIGVPEIFGNHTDPGMRAIGDEGWQQWHVAEHGERSSGKDSPNCRIQPLAGRAPELARDQGYEDHACIVVGQESKGDAEIESY